MADLRPDALAVYRLVISNSIAARSHGMRNEISSSEKDRNREAVVLATQKAERNGKIYILRCRAGDQVKPYRGKRESMLRVFRQWRGDRSQKNEQRWRADHGA